MSPLAGVHETNTLDCPFCETCKPVGGSGAGKEQEEEDKGTKFIQ